MIPSCPSPSNMRIRVSSSNEITFLGLLGQVMTGEACYDVSKDPSQMSVLSDTAVRCSTETVPSSEPPIDLPA